jgi:membrane-associated phospholipid phosphatase
MTMLDINDQTRDLLSRRKTIQQMLIAAWFGMGLLLIFFDDSIQPFLTAFGGHPIVKGIAQNWQELGATLGIVCFLVAGIVTIRHDRGRTFILYVLVIFAAGGAVQIAKHLIGRARPNFVNDQTHFYGPFGMFYHGPRIQLDSMPSGHTTAAFAMAVALSYRWPKLTPMWFFLAAGVAVARTFVDCHFPSDVVIASCFGTVIGWAVCATCRRIQVAPVKS